MHLYFHVPFCARRCSYCDFAIAVRRETPSAAYRDAVIREWQSWLNAPLWDGSGPVETIYFGGGTPSRLDEHALAQILDRVRSDREVGPEVEVTLEANPDDVTPARARAWVDAGVNRISLGVQSFDPAVLAWMHRTHTADQVPAAASTLREAGLENLSMDLIYAVPGDLGRDWERDLDLLLELDPLHVSLYGLTVEPGTPLGRWTARNEIRAAPDQRAAEEYLHAHRRLEAGGYQHYEVSNAARPGYRSRHNSAYWDRRTYLGLGPSAHGADRHERWWNVREWAEYLRRSEAGEPLVTGRESLDPAERRLEDLYLGLRTVGGVAVEEIPDRLSTAWAAEGWAAVDADQVRLTPEGWLRLDALVAALPAP